MEPAFTFHNAGTGPVGRCDLGPGGAVPVMGRYAVRGRAGPGRHGQRRDAGTVAEVLPEWACGEVRVLDAAAGRGCEGLGRARISGMIGKACAEAGAVREAGVGAAGLRAPAAPSPSRPP